MTTDVLMRKAPHTSRRSSGPALPVSAIVLAIVVVWYAAAVLANWRGVTDSFARAGETHGTMEIVQATLAQKRPVVPAPHQILQELSHSVLEVPITSRRSLVYHAGITMSATLLGFAMGALLGIALAIAIVHLRSVDRSLMPWIIASQAVPILAVAPIVIVALGAMGLTGLIPKAIIAAYLCFFPVTVGMVKGLKAPDRLAQDLMRTYFASASQTLWRLKVPAALPYLFVSLKIAVAGALVGTIVGELPTGAQAGIGARLLAGSYYGQTIQIWAALAAAALLASLLVGAVSLVEASVARLSGVRSR